MDAWTISKSRDDRRLDDAWRQFESTLSDSELPDDELVAIWTEHVAGQYGDSLTDRSRRVARSEAGCLAWPYFRQRLRSTRLQPDALWHDIQRIELHLLKAVARVWERQGLPKHTLHRSNGLIEGMTNTFRMAALCVFQHRWTFPNEFATNGQSNVLTTGQAWRQAVESFARAVSRHELHRVELWRQRPCSIAISSSPRIQQRSLPELVRNQVREDLKQHFENRLSDDPLAWTYEQNALLTAASMVQFGVNWLLASRVQGRNKPPYHIWILLAEQSLGTAARLAWQTDRHVLPATVFPDPIRLGILPTDEEWIHGFERARCWALENTEVRIRQNLPAIRWSVRFLSERDCAQLGVIGEAGQSFRRPLQITGSSASVAQAVGLLAKFKGKSLRTRLAVTGSLGESGQVLPVASMQAKFDKVLWERFLQFQVQRSIIPRCFDADQREHEIGTAGRAIGDSRRVRTCTQMRQVVEACQEGMNRRLFLTGLTGTGALGIGGAWRWSALPLREQDVAFNVMIVKQGEDVLVPLTDASLPVMPGDGLQIEVISRIPVYSYLVWLDASGNIDPIWPWRIGDWSHRDKDRDIPRRTLTLPEPSQAKADSRTTNLYRLTSDVSGLQAIVLIARKSPLPANSDLLKDVAPLPQPGNRRLLYEGSAFFVDEQGVVEHRDRTPIQESELRGVSDPLSHLQHIVSTRAGQSTGVARAACFSFRDPMH